MRIRVCVLCVSEVGLAEMSKAGSHAVSGAADIAPTVWGAYSWRGDGRWKRWERGGAVLKVKEL